MNNVKTVYIEKRIIELAPGVYVRGFTNGGWIICTSDVREGKPYPLNNKFNEDKLKEEFPRYRVITVKSKMDTYIETTIE